MYRSGALHTGVVRAFDASRGLGHVGISEGSGDDHATVAAEILFHCIEIADGSRQIDVGTPVVFRLMRRLGAVEAVAITAVRSTDQ